MAAKPDPDRNTLANTGIAALIETELYLLVHLG
jgi:hypothetical protein